MATKGCSTADAHLVSEHMTTPDRGNGTRMIQPLVKPHSMPQGMGYPMRGSQVVFPRGTKGSK